MELRKEKDTRTRDWRLAGLLTVKVRVLLEELCYNNYCYKLRERREVGIVDNSEESLV